VYPLKKLMGLLVIVLAAACVAGTGSASADALCETNVVRPCEVAKEFPVGTEIKSVLRPETEFHFTGDHSVNCSSSTMEAVLTKNPVLGFGSPFLGEITKEEFKNCVAPSIGKCQTFKTKTLASPAEFLATEGFSGDGSLVGFSGAKVIEMACSVLSCNWEALTTEKFPPKHTFEGGSPPIEKVKVTYTRIGGSIACGNTFVAEGEREFTTPTTAFWVEG
jgi:hypothetical protein